jgi:hypothetical protein
VAALQTSAAPKGAISFSGFIELQSQAPNNDHLIDPERVVCSHGTDSISHHFSKKKRGRGESNRKCNGFVLQLESHSWAGVGIAPRQSDIVSYQ